ncbi:hypothetical protein [Candidatus Solirubrobacter pratensis]|uniref:hypothetical protein n=1 Tax=Candidatus Solirubrobacter pratensis TaxID=1298857 RepID=UPI0003FCBC89|nr:hypothetical protein [Candidatus Solirubrobacter pratensis]
MRSRLVLLCACLLALAIPAKASAAAIVGISENQPTVFSDPLFTSLGAKHARIVVAWDVVKVGGFDLTRVTQYLQAAQATGVEPLVAFEHSRGDASRCNQKRYQKTKVCKLPTASQYQSAIKAFLARFPSVNVIAPWNEANHFTQPTSRNPKAAAKFTDIVKSACPRCTLVVADMLDQADNPSASRPTFTATAKYIKEFRKALKTKRTVCGIHNYSDVNRFRTTGTKALEKALGCSQYWLTETGGLYKFGSFWSKKTYKGCKSASSCQVKATKYLFSTAAKDKKIKRIYVYTWFGAVTPRFDAGLVAHGVRRAAYDEVAKHVE